MARLEFTRRLRELGISVRNPPVHIFTNVLIDDRCKTGLYCLSTGIEAGRIAWARLYMEPVEQESAAIDEAVRRLTGNKGR